MVWSILRNRQLAGLKFRRQVPIGPYIADFFCREIDLVVELDGETHDFRVQYDAERSQYLKSQHLRVFRVQNADVYRDLEAVAFAILRAAGIDVEKYLAEHKVPVSDQTAPSP